MVTTGRRGAIVAVTSVSAFLADRGLRQYAASKAALVQVVRIAATSSDRTASASTRSPGTTDTPLRRDRPEPRLPRSRAGAPTPLGGVGPADGVAEAIVALTQLDWVTGQVLTADGGVSLFSPIDPMERD